LSTILKLILIFAINHSETIEKQKTPSAVAAPSSELKTEMIETLADPYTIIL
jgi:hypothetical protein